MSLDSLPLVLGLLTIVGSTTGVCLAALLLREAILDRRALMLRRASGPNLMIAQDAIGGEVVSLIVQLTILATQVAAMVIASPAVQVVVPGLGNLLLLATSGRLLASVLLAWRGWQRLQLRRAIMEMHQ